MASSAPNKAFLGRTAAILTTGEVAGNAFDLNNAHEACVTVDLSFTIGSLTNVIVRFYVSMDGTTYDPIAVNGTLTTETITASVMSCAAAAAPKPAARSSASTNSPARFPSPIEPSSREFL